MTIILLMWKYKKMILTKCQNCVFLDENKCLENKDIFLEKDTYYTKGYCSIKRDSNWATNVPFPYIDKINKENKDIAIIIYFKENETLEDFKNILNKIKNEHIQEYMFILRNIKIAPEIYKILNEDKDISLWHIKAISSADITIDQSINESVTDIKSNNVLFVQDKDNVSNLNEFIINKNKYLLVSDHNYLNYLCNKNAFMQLGGNIHNNWINKIRSFQQWEEECLILNQESHQ
jgi:hypothetical protein